MAKETLVILTDDITGEKGDNVESFSVKIPNYVLDESDGSMELIVERWTFDGVPSSQKQFLDDLHRNMKKYRTNKNVAVKTVGSGDGSTSGEYTEAMDKRDFAKANKLNVSERGRISADITEKYNKAIADGSWVKFQNAPKTDAENGENDTDTDS